MADKPKTAGKTAGRPDLTGFQEVGHAKLSEGEFVFGSFLGIKPIESRLSKGQRTYYFAVAIDTETGPRTIVGGSILFSRLLSARPSVGDKLYIEKGGITKTSGGYNAREWIVKIRREGGVNVPILFDNPEAVQPMQLPAGVPLSE